MKKILLGTTALFGFAAGTAMADPLHVMLGGTIESQFGVVDQHDGYDIVGGNVGSVSAGNPAIANGYRTHKTNLGNKAEVHVHVSHKADNGMVYGGSAGLATTAQHDDKFPPKNARTFLFMENKYGRLEFGSNYGVDATMKVDATHVARATGGVNGQWFWFANVSTGQTNSIMHTPGGNNPLENLIANTAAPTADPNYKHYTITPNFITTAQTELLPEDTRKVSYYTPRWWGFQGGVSFISDSGMYGNKYKVTNNTTSDCCTTVDQTARGSIKEDAENITTFALNYKGKVDTMGLEASLMVNMGHAEASYYRHLREYQFGAALSFAGFKLAGSYQDSGKSLTKRSDTVSGGHIWTVGASYANGPVGASVTFLTSHTNKNRFNNLSVGADYQLARGLMPYIEVSFFDFKPAGLRTRTSSNDGTVFILGTELTF